MNGATRGARCESKRLKMRSLAGEQVSQHERRKLTTAYVPSESTPSTHSKAPRLNQASWTVRIQCIWTREAREESQATKCEEYFENPRPKKGRVVSEPWARDKLTDLRCKTNITDVYETGMFMHEIDALLVIWIGSFLFG